MNQPAQSQPVPGLTTAMDPRPDHGEESYKGAGKLEGRAAVITGGDSGIGHVIAIAFAREGADALVSYLDEHEDAEETKRWVEAAGRRCLLVPGDIQDADLCRNIVGQAAETFGRLDILVNNAAFQTIRTRLEDISFEEWRRTFATNFDAMIHLCQAALPRLKAGASIINTTSVIPTSLRPS